MPRPIGLEYKGKRAKLMAFGAEAMSQGPLPRDKRLGAS